MKTLEGKLVATKFAGRVYFDKNDPTIDVKNGTGDMLFQGIIDNVNGGVSLVNYTGGILTQGSINAKNLNIVNNNSFFVLQNLLFLLHHWHVNLYIIYLHLLKYLPKYLEHLVVKLSTTNL